jgi:hypothetical protein
MRPEAEVQGDVEGFEFRFCHPQDRIAANIRELEELKAAA